eukprot:c53930_g1_i1 orf=159-542(-)
MKCKPPKCSAAFCSLRRLEGESKTQSHPDRPEMGDSQNSSSMPNPVVARLELGYLQSRSRNAKNSTGKNRKFVGRSKQSIRKCKWVHGRFHKPKRQYRQKPHQVLPHQVFASPDQFTTKRADDHSTG